MRQETEDQILFVRKVLGIVTVQMSLAFLFCLIMTACKSFGGLFATWQVFLVALGIYTGSIIVLVSKEEWRSTSPRKQIALISCTFAMVALIATFAATLNALPFVTLVMGCAVACGCLFLASLYTSDQD